MKSILLSIGLTVALAGCNACESHTEYMARAVTPYCQTRCQIAHDPGMCQVLCEEIIVTRDAADEAGALAAVGVGVAASAGGRR